MKPTSAVARLRRARAHLAEHPWRRRLVVFAAACLIFQTVGATWAVAAGHSLHPLLGIPILDFIQINDSHGINAWKYVMSLDRGDGFPADPGKMAWSGLVAFGWTIYTGGVMVTVWFLTWLTSFDWLPLLTNPLLTISDELARLMTGAGIGPFMLSLGALVAIVYMARGRVATGLWELMVTLIVGSLATGLLNNPIHAVLDPGVGLVYHARDIAFELAASLTRHGTGTSSDIGSALVDAFIRIPHQLVNFGTVLDGTSCQGAYNASVSSGPHTGNELRDAVNGCNTTAGTYAANPGPSMLGTLFMLGLTSLILGAFGFILAVVVIVAALSAALEAVQIVIAVWAGIVPGPGRDALAGALARSAVSLFVVTFSYIFLAIYLHIVVLLFSTGSTPIGQRIFVVDIVMIAGVILFMKKRKQLEHAASALAARLAWRPGGGSRSAASGNTSGGSLLTAGVVATSVIRTVHQARQAKRAVNRHRGRPTPTNTPPNKAPTSTTRTTPAKPSAPGRRPRPQLNSTPAPKTRQARRSRGRRPSPGAKP